MIAVNDDGHRSGPIGANAALEMALGYSALASISDAVSEDAMDALFAETHRADLAAAIGRGIAANLDLLLVRRPASASGIPLTRRTR